MRMPLAALAALLLVPAAAASAQLPAGPLASDDVELITNIAKHNDSAGARRVGDYFYITTERDLTIYEIGDHPEAPVEVGHLDFDPTLIAKDYYVDIEEDVDTDGRFLLGSRQHTLEVVDVRDKTDPRIIGTAGDEPQHTISCVLGCTYAYGSAGAIVDLTDPANPRVVGDWAEGLGLGSTHDVTEVAPGIVMTSSTPMVLLDAREDPAHPTVLNTAGAEDDPFVHANLWPNQATDDIVLVGGESIGPQCQDDAAAAFHTYDGSTWAQGGELRPLDEFRMQTGLIADGRMVDSSFCVHWFTPRPGYRNGGVIAIAWYEHGTRFLHIGEHGEITELGHFLPLGAQASAAYWITDEILYIADYVRGLDVVRYTGPLTP